jgi:hypothetical protein
MIKFSGLHLHMVLVLAVICVVAYVFYISKDIVALDREIKMLHGKVEQLASRMQSPSQQPPRPSGAAPGGGSAALQQQQAKLMAQARGTAVPQGVAKTAAVTPAPAVFPPAKAAGAAPVPPRPQAPQQVPQQQATPRPKVFEIEDSEEEEDTTEEETTEETEDEIPETGSDTAERVKELLSNVEAGGSGASGVEVKVEEPVVEVKESPPDSLQKLSWTEIKDKCREMGIPIKGSNKEQLLGKLVEALKS